MTQDTVTRPPKPEAPGKRLVYVAVAVPVKEWRIAGEGALCGFRHGGRDIGCDEPAVAEKAYPTMAIYPWRAYCGVHAADKRHWVEDGKVMTWELRRQGREDRPLAVEEVARALSGSPGMCPQHKRPKSECAPWDRHGHSIRFREDDWQATERAAAVAELDTSAVVAHAVEAMQDHLRCDRGRCATDAPPVPVIWGDLAGKTLGKWIAEAVEQVRSQHPRHEPVTVGAEPSPAVTR